MSSASFIFLQNHGKLYSPTKVKHHLTCFNNIFSNNELISNRFAVFVTLYTHAYRSIEVHQRSYSEVGHIIVSDLKRVSLKIVRQNRPTKSSQVGVRVRVSTLRQLNCKQETSPNSVNQ